MIETPAFIKGMKEVSSLENGAKVLFATDDFFAVAENMLKPDEPQWKATEYTEFGKWMDGWETRRKRIAGHDWVIIALATISNLTGICVDTAYFTGNYAPRFSLQATYLVEDVDGVQSRKNKMGTAANNEELSNAEKLHSETWETLIPMTTLKNGSPDTRKNYFELKTGGRVFTHLRLNIFPDGGIARLRVYGQPSKSSLNLASLKPLGGKCVKFSNAHYGHPDVLLKPTPSKGMFDGWETARRLDRPANIIVDNNGFTLQQGEEWAILKLEKAIYIKHIEVDTSHFIGNCPDNVRIDGAFVKQGQDLNNLKWDTVLSRTKLMPNQTNGLTHPFIELITRPINHVKVTIAPDGGLARVRIYGIDA